MDLNDREIASLVWLGVLAVYAGRRPEPFKREGGLMAEDTHYGIWPCPASACAYAISVSGHQKFLAEVGPYVAAPTMVDHLAKEHPKDAAGREYAMKMVRALAPMFPAAEVHAFESARSEAPLETPAR